MASKPATFFANLLHYYKSRWIHELSKSSIRYGNRFSNLFRFIDDIAAIADLEESERSSKEIYSPTAENKGQHKLLWEILSWLEN